MEPACASEAADLDFIRRLVRERSAIILDHGKDYLIQARLGPVAREHGCRDLAELTARLRHDVGLRTEVVEAMTTNETSFFRDLHPFDALRDVVLPDLIKRRGGTRRLQLWSAACSTGQEPFSLAMLLRDHPTLSGWNVRLTATDLSRDVLARAREGRFTAHEVTRGLSVEMLARHFRPDGADWRIADGVRAMIDFKPMNLVEPWPSLPKFDVVFLRNVLIYFEAATKREILGRVRSVLADDGLLFLGAAETTLNLADEFERVTVGKGACYRVRT